MKKQPLRMCVACRELKDKRQLIRLVRLPTGELQLDKMSGRLPGRGTYLCPTGECFKKARKARSLEKVLKMKIDDQIWQDLEAQLAEQLAACRAEATHGYS